MYHMRPGSRIPKGSKSYKAHPSVDPPVLLRLAAVLSVLSIIMVLIAYVIGALSSSSANYFEPATALYIAIGFFIIPLGIVHTVSMNNPLSRSLLLIFVFMNIAAVCLDFPFYADLPLAFRDKVIAICFIGSVILYWLFRNPRARYYYAAITGRPLAKDLAQREQELADNKWLSAGAQRKLDWFTEHMETIILLGFVVVVLLAFLGTTLKFDWVHL